MSGSATVSDLRRRNRALVLRALLDAGESTRANLAVECSLSTATLTNVVSLLINEGLVEEIGLMPSNGGRPIARLSPRRDGAYFIGADVGEHDVTVELYDLRLRQVDRVVTRIGYRLLGPESVRDALSEGVASLRSRNAVVGPRIVGIGLGVPGTIEATGDGQAVIETQSLGWPLLKLDELFHDDALPVFVENGAKTMAIAEVWSGSARSAKYCIAGLIGRGVGAGVINDGALLRGSAGSAGEWGHTKVALQGRRCRCGSRGCLEAYVGGTAIIERWVEAGASTTADEEEELARLFASAGQGDSAAKLVVEDTIEILGLGLANLVNLFNPEVIVLGGWVGLALTQARIEDIDAKMRASSLDHPSRAVRLEMSELGLDAVALGAARLPLEQLIEGHLPAPAVENFSKP